jgi:TMEM175 potassium channel family protein
MPISYHRFAGSSLDRLAALSDGVFAVAMTLLVLDLKAPSVPKRAQHPIWSGGGGASEHVLLHGLTHDVAPRLLPYAMSFLTLGSSGLASRRSFPALRAALAH